MTTVNPVETMISLQGQYARKCTELETMEAEAKSLASADNGDDFWFDAMDDARAEYVEGQIIYLKKLKASLGYRIDALMADHYGHVATYCHHVFMVNAAAFEARYSK